jgi:hypothetical protein
LSFLCFASVQNCGTYPPARGKNKQALKINVVFACCMDMKQQKFDLLHLSTKEILEKEYKHNNQKNNRTLQDLCIHNTILKMKIP